MHVSHSCLSVSFKILLLTLGWEMSGEANRKMLIDRKKHIAATFPSSG